jgi:hypothetical protein
MCHVGTAQTRKTSAKSLYIKLFLLTGLPFGAIMGAFAGLAIGLVKGWEYGLAMGLGTAVLSGLFFGGLMSAILGTMALASTSEMDPGALDVDQRSSVDMRGSREDVLAQVATALSNLPRVRSTDVDELAGRVEAKLGWSWRSFGEVVTATLGPEDSGHFPVRVESRPSLGATMVDYGRNRMNVDAVVAELDRVVLGLEGSERDIYQS